LLLIDFSDDQHEERKIERKKEKDKKCLQRNWGNFRQSIVDGTLIQRAKICTN